MNTPPLHPALVPLIEALARQAAEEYLTAQSASNEAEIGERSDHVPLHQIHKAA